MHTLTLTALIQLWCMLSDSIGLANIVGLPPNGSGVVTLTGTCQGAVASHAEDDAHRDDGLALQTSSSKAVEVHRLEIVV